MGGGKTGRQYRFNSTHRIDLTRCQQRQWYSCILYMSHERLGALAPEFHSAKAVHAVMDTVKFSGLLARMREAGSPFSRLGLSNIHTVCGRKLCCLNSRHHLEIVKSKFLAHLQPRILNEKGVRTVVLMVIDGPVCKDDIRMLSLKNLAILTVTLVCDLDFSVDLTGKDGFSF
jgi:hypothetical protein